LGHLTCKIVSEMTYNVSSGTLNPTIQYYRSVVLYMVVFSSSCWAPVKMYCHESVYKRKRHRCWYRSGCCNADPLTELLYRRDTAALIKALAWR